MAWRRVHASGPAPGQRTGHAAAVLGNRMYLFGGMAITSSGPHLPDTLSALDLGARCGVTESSDDAVNSDTYTWHEVPLGTAPIPARLDHAMTAVSYHTAEASQPSTAGSTLPQAHQGAVSHPVIVDITEGFVDARAQSAGADTAPVAEHALGVRVDAIVVSGGVNLEGVVFDDYLLYRP